MIHMYKSTVAGQDSKNSDAAGGMNVIHLLLLSPVLPGA
jgi:hypothetical protein